MKKGLPQSLKIKHQTL